MNCERRFSIHKIVLEKRQRRLLATTLYVMLSIVKCKHNGDHKLMNISNYHSDLQVFFIQKPQNDCTVHDENHSIIQEQPWPTTDQQSIETRSWIAGLQFSKRDKLKESNYEDFITIGMILRSQPGIGTCRLAQFLDIDRPLTKYHTLKHRHAYYITSVNAYLPWSMCA